MGSLKIGPGGGSAARVPPCYGLGGERPTVTDANLVLGYLNPKALAGGTVSISKKLSEQAVNKYIAEPMKLGSDGSSIWDLYGCQRVNDESCASGNNLLGRGIQEISFCLHLAEQVVCTLLTSQKR